MTDIQVSFSLINLEAKGGPPCYTSAFVYLYTGSPRPFSASSPCYNNPHKHQASSIKQHTPAVKHQQHQLRLLLSIETSQESANPTPTKSKASQ
jgi:hypothetical protein